MSKQEDTSDQTSAICGAVYQDAKSLLKKSISLAADPIKRRLEKKTFLASFHPNFKSHDESQTQIVDYFAWHESDRDWQEGNGLLTVASYGELNLFWTIPSCFIEYEARLRRYIKGGGEVRRVFVIGHEVRSDASYWLLTRAIRRHEALQFGPRVVSVLDLKREVAAIGVACDSFAAFHGRIGYFMRFDEPTHPTLLRTLDPVFAYKCQSLLGKLWARSTSGTDFLKKRNLEVPAEVSADIQKDIDAVEDLSD